MTGSPAVDAFLDRLAALMRSRRRIPEQEIERTLAEAGEHLADTVDELMDAGWSRPEAAREALRRFGPPDELATDLERLWHERRRRPREAGRPGDTGPSGPRFSRLGGTMRAWIDDSRRALRTVGRRPGLTLVAVVTLALGIGATTAIFSLADWAVFRPVPAVPEPEELGIVWAGISRDDGSFTVGRVSYPNYVDMEPRLETLAGLAGYQSSTLNLAAGDAEPRPVSAQFVTHGYFDVLGARPVRGRSFTPGEDDPLTDGRPVAIISHRVWRGDFGGRSDILGRDLWVNGERLTVVGVAPQGFHGTERVDQVDVWLPGATTPRIRHFEPGTYAQRDSGGYYEFVARLAPGRTWEQAQAELASMADWLRERHPEANASFEEVGFRVFPEFGSRPLGGDRLASTMNLLLGIVGLILLIACTNVAGVVLAHGLRRRPEMAVRKALGAGGWHLARQHLLEGLFLWAIGGAAGLGVALVLPRLFAGVAPGELVLMMQSASLDLRVLAFAAAVSLAAGLVFSIVPALAAARVDAAAWLHETARISGGRRRWGRVTFSVVQLAASMVLLVGALLFTRTLWNLNDVDTGFDASGVTVFTVEPGEHGYEAGRREAYVRELVRALEAQGGVEVTLAQRAPFSSSRLYTRIRPAGGEGGAVAEPLSSTVPADYFDLLRIPILRGRNFADQAGPGGDNAEEVILSRLLARELFGEEDPLGRLVEFPIRGEEGRRYPVVGIVEETRYSRLTGDPEPMVYRELAAGAIPGRPIILARAEPPGRELVPAVRRVARELDPTLPVARIATLEENVARSVADRSFFATLLGSLAVLALVLAAVGLYGVVSFGVAQRTRELGIRMALGASRAHVIGRVLRETAAIAVVGVAIGSAGAAAAVRLVESQLYGVGGYEPGVWLVATALMGLVCGLAALRPGLQASGVDPVEALRTDGGA